MSILQPFHPPPQVVTNKYYELIMLVLILASCVELCFDDANVVDGSKKAAALHVMDIFFTIAFGIEVRILKCFYILSRLDDSPCLVQAVMKIITYGFAFTGKFAYMRRSWNVLDLFVVIVGILVLALEHVMNPGYIKWLRVFRALRCEE